MTKQCINVTLVTVTTVTYDKAVGLLCQVNISKQEAVMKGKKMNAGKIILIIVAVLLVLGMDSLRSLS